AGLVPLRRCSGVDCVPAGGGRGPPGFLLGGRGGDHGAHRHSRLQRGRRWWGRWNDRRCRRRRRPGRREPRDSAELTVTDRPAPGSPVGFPNPREPPVKLAPPTLCLVLSALADPAGPEVRAHCNLGALSSAERARDKELIPVLAGALRERKDLTDGYAY